MENENLILVVKAKPWSFTDKESGEVKQGVKLFYLDKTALTEDEYNGYGYATFENSIDSNTEVQVPAYYKPTFVTYVKSGMRCTKLSNVEFVKDASIWN